MITRRLFVACDRIYDGASRSALRRRRLLEFKTLKTLARSRHQGVRLVPRSHRTVTTEKVWRFSSEPGPEVKKDKVINKDLWIALFGSIGSILACQQLYESKFGIADKILASTLDCSLVPVYIERSKEEERFRDLMDRSKENSHHTILVYGNHQVGKSVLLERYFGQQVGVVYLAMSGSAEAEDQLVSVLSARDPGEVKRACIQVAKYLERLPVVIIDIPRGQVDPRVMASVSTFAKVWGYDLKLVKVIVVASCASAALSIDVDNRTDKLFISPLSNDYLENPQLDEFLRFHGGEDVVRLKTEMFNLTGGTLGHMQDTADKLNHGAHWEEIKARKLKDQLMEARYFFGIDEQDGFGPACSKGAALIAKAVASAPYAEGAVEDDLPQSITPRDFAITVRARCAHPIYHINARKRAYVATSPTQHVILKQECIRRGLLEGSLTETERAMITCHHDDKLVQS